MRETILITGASSGIGKATALYLAKKGYRVIGTSRSKGRLSEIAAAAALGLPITGVEIDINCDESVSNGMGAVLAEHGRIDVLVNNAGYGLWGPIERLTLDEVKAQFESNLFAVLRMIRAVAPGMMDRGYGKIINMSSVEGRLGNSLQRRVRLVEVCVGRYERGAPRGDETVWSLRCSRRAGTVPDRFPTEPGHRTGGGRGSGE